MLLSPIRRRVSIARVFSGCLAVLNKRELPKYAQSVF